MKHRSLLIHLPSSFRAGFCIVPITCTLAMTGPAHAKGAWDAVTQKDAASSEDTPVLRFEVTCDLNGGRELSIGEGHTAVADPPEMETCRVFGDQNLAYYMCRCLDREEASEGTIEAALIPSLARPSKADGLHRHVFDSLSEVCQAQFETSCGPFPKPIERSCASENAECVAIATRNTRSLGFNQVRSHCDCKNGESWSVRQTVKGVLSIDEWDLQDQCERSLSSCGPGGEPLFMDEQDQSGDRFASQTFSCAFSEGGRSDQCWVEVSESGDQNLVKCDCSGNERAGRITSSLEQSATDLRGVCQSALDSCKDFKSEKPNFPDESRANRNSNQGLGQGEKVEKDEERLTTDGADQESFGGHDGPVEEIPFQGLTTQVEMGSEVAVYRRDIPIEPVEEIPSRSVGSRGTHRVLDGHEGPVEEIPFQGLTTQVEMVTEVTAYREDYPIGPVEEIPSRAVASGGTHRVLDGYEGPVEEIPSQGFH